MHLRAANDPKGAAIKDKLEIPDNVEVSQKTREAVAKPLPTYLATIPEVNVELIPSVSW